MVKVLTIRITIITGTKIKIKITNTRTKPRLPSKPTPRRLDLDKTISRTT